MKISKVICVLVLLFTSLWAKDTVPKELIGFYSQKLEECNPNIPSIMHFNVTSTKIYSYEDVCNVKKVTTLKDGSYNIKANCTMEGEPYEGDFDLKKEKKNLILNKKFYYYPCK